MSEARDLLAEPEDVPVHRGFVALTRHSIVFALGAIAGKAVGLVMLPVLTRILGPAQYGSLDVLMSLGSAATATLLLGLDVGALRLYFDQPDDRSRRTLFATWLTIGLGVSGVAAILILWQAPSISGLLFHDSAFHLGVAAVAVVVVAQTVQVVVLTALRAEGRPWVYALVSGGVLALYGVLAVLLLVWWRADAIAVMWAWAIALVVSSAAGMTVLGGNVRSQPSRDVALRLFRLGLPLAPGVTATLVADFANRAILLGARGPSEVGFYTVAVRFASVAALALTGFQLAWQPHAFALGTSAAALSRIGNDGRRIVSMVAILVTAVAALGPELIQTVAGRPYDSAVPALGFSLIATLGTALFLVESLPSIIARETRDVGLAMGMGVGLALALNLALVTSAGSTGTAAAVATGQLTSAGIVAILGRRRLRIQFGSLRLVSIVVATIGVVLAVTIAAPDASLGVRVVTVLAVCIMVLLLERARTGPAIATAE